MILRFKAQNGQEHQWFMLDMPPDLITYVNGFRFKGWDFLAVQHHVPMSRRTKPRKRGKNALSDRHVITSVNKMIDRCLRDISDLI